MSEYKANFLWPNIEGSLEMHGYEFANAGTEGYRRIHWDAIVCKIADLEKQLQEAKQSIDKFIGEENEGVGDSIELLKAENASLRAKLDEYRDRAEQEEVQLAGVSTAAMGYTYDVAVRGDYGWHPAYQDTLDLRIKYDKLVAKLERLRKGVCEHEHCTLPACAEYQLNHTIFCDADILAIGHRCAAEEFMRIWEEK
jgi:regulator of replication initiation timing